jgi:hypothetical protein
MKWTNLYNLPAPLAEAIKNDPYEKVGDISVTGLNQPPQLRQLRLRHDAEVEEDVSDHIWRFFGQLGHGLIERFNSDAHLAEERLTENVRGWVLSGKFDLYDPAAKKLSDYKFTSVYAFLLGAKIEWERQLNVYRWMLERAGFPVEQIEIVAILRDWNRRRSKMEADYPPAASLTVEIPLWPMEKTAAEVERLVEIHQAATLMPDEELPTCTPEDRWAKPTTYAVKKHGAKRAQRVFEDRAVADALAKELGMEVEMRPGEDTRCEDYCPVKQFCAQYRAAHQLKKAA